MEKLINFKAAYLLLMLSIVLETRGFAQSADTISLNQCIDIAIQNNQSLKNKRLDVLINQAKIAESKADLNPQIKIKGNYQYYPTVPTSLIESSAFGGPPGQYSATQLLVPQSISGSIEVSWQVYNPAILSALKISRLSKSISETTAQERLEAVVYDVSATYFNIQINDLQADLTRSNIANLKRNLELTTQLHSQGLALKSDIDNLMLSITNLESVLNNQLNGTYQLLYLLKIYMGLTPSTPLCIQKFSNREVAYHSLTNVDTTSYTKRSSYKSLQQTGDLFLLHAKSIKAGYLPSLNLVGSFGYSGFNPEFKFFQTYNNKWYATNLLQLNIEIPIFDGLKKRNQILQNKYQQNQNFNTLQNLKNSLQMEQINAVNNYNLYVKDVDYQAKNVALANKLYNQRLLEYKNAGASLNDMITVENTLKAAQANYLNALVKLKVAELDIKKANGELIKK